MPRQWTPWGTADSWKAFGEGITFYGTPEHGGFHVRHHLNVQIPDYMRRRGGWYEEDCEWSIIATVFPDRFSSKEQEQARATFRNWFPAEYERFYGVTLAPGESFMRDREVFNSAREQDVTEPSGRGRLAALVEKLRFPEGDRGHGR
jgi:hypothetical protein